MLYIPYLKDVIKSIIDVVKEKDAIVFYFSRFLFKGNNIVAEKMHSVFVDIHGKDSIYAESLFVEMISAVEKSRPRRAA